MLTDATRRGVPVVNSRDVAEKFGKEHRNVLRDIDAILAPGSDVSAGIKSTGYDADGQTETRNGPGMVPGPGLALL